MSELKADQPAPDFELPDQAGNVVRLSQFRGRRAVVVYFYPKDETTGCTAEACSFRDAFPRFEGADAEIIGISDDSQESHAKFAAKHNLPFKLLSDTGGKVRKLFGVKKTLGIIPGRVTYVIDKAGIVRHVFSSQTAFTKHVTEALAGLAG